MSEFIDGLTISSMIFFNILCFLGIIALLMIIRAVSSIKRKSEETMDMAQGVLFNINESVDRANESFVGEIIATIASIFGSRSRKNKRTFWK